MPQHNQKSLGVGLALQKSIFDGTKLPVVAMPPKTTTYCVFCPFSRNSLTHKSARFRPVSARAAQILGTVSPIGDKIELAVTIVAREHHEHGSKRT